MQEKNTFFRVPKIYKVIAEQLEEAKKNGKLLVPCDKTNGNDTCYSFLQDMGIILFNRNTQMVCVDPQLMAKVLALFVMPPAHEEAIFGNIPSRIKDLSILPHQLVEERIIKSKIATNYNILEIIECLQQFDFCYKLDSEEEKMYNTVGYLFPCLRKVAPLSLKKHQENTKLLT